LEEKVKLVHTQNKELKGERERERERERAHDLENQDAS
jgi:hypothetical protein